MSRILRAAVILGAFALLTLVLRRPSADAPRITLQRPPPAAASSHPPAGPQSPHAGPFRGQPAQDHAEILDLARALDRSQRGYSRESPEYRRLRATFRALADRGEAGQRAIGALLANPRLGPPSEEAVSFFFDELPEPRRVAILRLSFEALSRSLQGRPPAEEPYQLLRLKGLLLRLRGAEASRLHQKLLDDPALGKYLRADVLRDVVSTRRPGDVELLDKLVREKEVTYEDLPSYLLALSQTRGPGTFRTLRQYCDHPNPMIRNEAIELLSGISHYGDRSLTPYLLDLLPKVTGEQELQVVLALARLEEPAGWQAIARLLDSADPDGLSRVVKFLCGHFRRYEVYYAAHLGAVDKQRAVEFWKGEVARHAAQLGRQATNSRR